MADMTMVRATTHKICSLCREDKPRDEFYVDKHGYLGARCKPCLKTEVKKWGEANPEKLLASRRRGVRAFHARNPGYQRRNNLKRFYGITIEQYDEMLARQHGVCGMCEKPPDPEARFKNLSVDHDHETGQVRGLLCHTCNLMLGQIECAGLLDSIGDVVARYLTQSFGG